MRFLASGAAFGVALIASRSDAFTPVHSRKTTLASSKVSTKTLISVPYKVQQKANVSFFSSSSPNTDSVENEAAAAPFENDGVFAWMVPSLKVIGFEEGRELYGAIPMPVAATVRPFSASSSTTRTTTMDESESARKRAQAAADMVNIGFEERQRRDALGKVFAGLTALYAVYATLFADQGDVLGHVVRFVTVVPLFLAVGFQVSAQQGLCNVAQAGLWDVGDGKGLTPVDDPSLARALLQKVNDMNISTAIQCLVPTAIFAALPHSSAVTLVFSGLIVGALYALNGKIPSVSN